MHKHLRAWLPKRLYTNQKAFEVYRGISSWFFKIALSLISIKLLSKIDTFNYSVLCFVFENFAAIFNACLSSRNSNSLHSLNISIKKITHRPAAFEYSNRHDFSSTWSIKFEIFFWENIQKQSRKSTVFIRRNINCADSISAISLKLLGCASLKMSSLTVSRFGVSFFMLIIQQKIP